MQNSGYLGFTTIVRVLQKYGGKIFIRTVNFYMLLADATVRRFF